MKKIRSTPTIQIGIIILAAGASRRMGTPKQLLKIRNQTLIEKALTTAISLKNQQTVIVLGANAEKISKVIPNQSGLFWIINEDWQKGMGTTLRAGVKFFLAKKQLPEAILIMVCDQPYLTTEILQRLISTFINNKSDIVAAKYNGIKGVPALFSKKLFPKLAQLKKDEGARKIIKNYEGKIATIDFPKGIIDLDTPEAYQEFLQHTQNQNE